MFVGVTLEDRVAFGTVAAKRLEEVVDAVSDGATVVVFRAAGFSHTALMTETANPAAPSPRPATQIQRTCCRGADVVGDFRVFDAIVVYSVPLGVVSSAFTR
jgi:hypothetical protein